MKKNRTTPNKQANNQDWRELDPEYERERTKYANPLPSRGYIIKVLADHEGPLAAGELYEHLGLDRDVPFEAFEKRLGAMVRDGQLVQNRKGAYGPVKRMQVIAGRVISHRDGYGFLTPDAGGPDIFLNPRQMRSLLPGDRVLVRVTAQDARGRLEGVLVEVLERSTQLIVGRYMQEQGVGYVIPDNPRIQQDVLIPPDQHLDARHGQIVVAELTTPPGERTLPVGRITEVLGDHLAPGMEIEAAIRTHGLPHEWPDEVEREAAALPTEVRPQDCTGREDLRHLPLVTIDGADARDFDDAVYAEPQRSGWKLWVAIADVGAYVKPDSPLDREGADRGNSVYFPERVIPMLPEALSNGLCSLNPQVDRLCMVCEMHVGQDGEVSRSRFFEGVMRSRARLIYDEVADILDNPQGAHAQRRAEVVPHLQTLNAVFDALFAAREQRGAIDFETVETKIVFGADRKIERIVPVQRNRAHRLIEECMIAANVQAALLVAKRKLPAPYRVHQPPDGEKITGLREFLAERGLRLPGGTVPEAADFSKMLARVKDRLDFNLIQTVMLRSLMQARYSAENAGHFGLALTHYAHFTSPIRRYPDLLLHRALKHIIHRRSHEDFAYTAEQMEAQGAHCSTTERRADEATRDVMVWLKCEYMRHHVGESYAGVVTGVAGFGLFVELQGLYVEGLVHVSTLKNDYYQFEPKLHRLRGERSGRVYSLGQPIRVKVVRVNLDERKIDLEPLDQGPETGSRAPTERRREPQSGKGKRKRR